MHTEAAESGTHCSLVGGSGGIVNAGFKTLDGMVDSVLLILLGTEMLALCMAPAELATVGKIPKY